ncbi:2,3-bisphosphoglycerate-independent phosphoglycerate mutase [Patescibacteria group bacterium]|nr:2,3-bisphosphoglycerate-independent phosphoglycerate mutase [Patescibacteria group bacterium]MBU4141446.1 2,3-bisphosphoglycerate-independent phosphoglycerate mutase [Patescibacteria group bacterium]
MYKPVVLLILDGWGINFNSQGNAIAQANTPTIDSLWRHYPALALQASSIAVGLPWGEMGNSEVGHTILGAGRIVYQSLPRITLSIQNGSFFTNPAFLNAISRARNHQSAIHLFGLLSNGGVHSHIEHLNALVELLKNENFSDVFLHIFTDGRDTMPDSGIKFINDLEQILKDLNVGKIASVSGRYWAMDRNNSWGKTQKVYECIIGNGENSSSSAFQALADNYEKGITDEFIPPTFIENKNDKGERIGMVKDNDAVIFFNFREDRARQLTKAFTAPNFDGFKRSKDIANLYFVTMTEYEKDIASEVAFQPERIVWPLARVLSEKGLKQLHIAETEKYAHVTYFFNGGNEISYPGETRRLIPSLSISNFAKRPEMSVDEISNKIVTEISRGIYDFIIGNFANADMVGHTGDLGATIKAVEAVDKNLAKVVNAALTYNAALLITADHGNAEEKINPLTGETLTEHTSNPVPLWFVTPKNKINKNQTEIMNEQGTVKGLLADVAPTILDLMEIKKPEEMTGRSLLPLLEENIQE